MQKLSLNGQWNLTYQDLGKPEEKWARWIPAQVPGDVHLDLLRAGLISEPLVALNSTRYHWIEDKEWLYQRIFEFPEDFGKQHIELVCDGLDLSAVILLNGEKVGCTNNMFIQHRFDVTHLVKPGRNELMIKLDVGFEATRGAPVHKFDKAWGRNEPRRPWLRKAQQAFYWDVAPRLVTCGIWRDVSLEIFEPVILRDVHVTSMVEGASAKINVHMQYESRLKIAVECQVEVSLRDTEQEIQRVFPLFIDSGQNAEEFSFFVDNPKLWYPNGMGEPHLYQMTIRLLNGQAGLCYGEISLRHGIRTISILQEPINDKEKTFTFVVNGVKVFCKGGNWVPSDAIYARINREKEYQLLKYAQQANFNMIRVWGGGVYPDQWFYDICDELGIMVWQDFMYACAYYPDDEPDFCEAARREAEWIVRKFRNHASLALWCGNNENYWMHHRVAPNEPFYGLKIYEQILPDVIRRLDNRTYYHPSSPYPGPAVGQENEGDQHIWSYTLGWYDINKKNSVWDYPEQEKADVMRIWDIAERNHKFVSEFGVWCPSNPASLQKYMGEFPAVMEGPVYQHHRNHFEADFILEALRRFYKRRESYFPEEFVIAGQMIQAEVIKHTLETFRGRMYVCSGTLFWEYNDTWGHVGYSPVDYYLNVRPLYYYMQRAFAPLHVVFKEQGREVWLLNDTLQTQQVSVEYGLQGFSGEIIAQVSKPISIQPCSAIMIGSHDDNAVDRQNTFAYAKVFDGRGQLLDRNRCFLVPLQDLVLPDDSMSYQIITVDSQTWRVTVSAKQFVWMVKIDADDNLHCTDNAFDLWPGESKTVTVQAEKANPSLDLRVNNINQFIKK